MDQPVDLDAYFERVGYAASRSPTIDTLHGLTEAHAESIPFENIDVLLGRRIRLETAALFHKLVTTRRGGYCFEQNGLFMAVLTQLGFKVRPLRAAVRLATPDRAIPTGHTHLVLEVTLDGEPWLTDVGVGSASLTRALRLVPDREQSTPHDTRRLVRNGGRWFHQIRRDGTWVDVYEFGGESMPLIDRTIANWYTSTYPDSKFRRDLTVALARPGGRRVTISNHELTLRNADGSGDKRALPDAASLRHALREYFNIELPSGARLWPVPGVAHANAQNPAARGHGSQGT